MYFDHFFFYPPFRFLPLQGDEQHHVDMPGGSRRVQHGRRRPTKRETGHAGQKVEVTPLRIGCRPPTVRFYHAIDL